MKKTHFGILILILNILSIGILVRSMGWILMITMVGIIPVVIYNAIISYWANRIFIKNRFRILLPNFLFLFFALTRIDIDDYSGYIGYSSFMSMIGLRDSIYWDTNEFNRFLVLNALTLGAIILLNSYTWYQLRHSNI